MAAGCGKLQLADKIRTLYSYSYNEAINNYDLVIGLSPASRYGLCSPLSLLPVLAHIHTYIHTYISFRWSHILSYNSLKWNLSKKKHKTNNTMQATYKNVESIYEERGARPVVRWSRKCHWVRKVGGEGGGLLSILHIPMTSSLLKVKVSVCEHRSPHTQKLLRTELRILWKKVYSFMWNPQAPQINDCIRLWTPRPLKHHKPITCCSVPVPVPARPESSKSTLWKSQILHKATSC